MSLPTSGGTDQAARRNAAGPRAADALALAASPTFAAMALLAGAPDGTPAEMLCSAGIVSPLSGMVTMYLLMCVFHLAPWLKLVRRRPPIASQSFALLKRSSVSSQSGRGERLAPKRSAPLRRG